MQPRPRPDAARRSRATEPARAPPAGRPADPTRSRSAHTMPPGSRSGPDWPGRAPAARSILRRRWRQLVERSQTRPLRVMPHRGARRFPGIASRDAAGNRHRAHASCPSAARRLIPPPRDRGLAHRWSRRNIPRPVDRHPPVARDTRQRPPPCVPSVPPETAAQGAGSSGIQLGPRFHRRVPRRPPPTLGATSAGTSPPITVAGDWSCAPFRSDARCAHRRARDQGQTGLAVVQAWQPSAQAGSTGPASLVKEERRTSDLL